jgi:hypothetical protein
MWKPTIKATYKCQSLKQVINGAKCNKKAPDGERYCNDCWSKLQEITASYEPKEITAESLHKAYLDRCND